MGASNTKTTEGNSNSNDITIIEGFQSHSDIVKICLCLIVIILVGHFIYKLYAAHKKNIKKSVLKSRVNIDTI